MASTELLNELLRAKFNFLHDSGAVAISPASLATGVYAEIDPKKSAPMLVQLAAILELRQLGRGVCRHRHIISEHEAEQSTLFDYALQDRYPALRSLNGEPAEECYVLREHLTAAERQKNIKRLRREADAKQMHADALEAETNHLIQNGLLIAEAGEEETEVTLKALSSPQE